MTEPCEYTQVGLPAAVDSDHQVEVLADAIVKIAVALGITDGTMPMTGPEVLFMATVSLQEIEKLKIREVPAP
jgi:hypothetical protein